MTSESELPNGAELARRVDQSIRTRSISKESLESKIEERFNTYFRDLRSNGLIRGVLVSSRAGERLGYIWNVFIEDFELDKAIDPRYKALNLLTWGLEEDLEPVLPLRISHLSPSMLEGCRRKCEELNIETDYIEV